MSWQDVLQLAGHIVGVLVGSGAVYKGTELVSYIFLLLKGEEMPGRAKALVSMALALVIPPAGYAVFLVDSGFTQYDFRALMAVLASSFMLAWAWYQKNKYSEKRA
jgi:hypothetical protein